MIRGKTPPYYKDSDITHDPSDLHFNLDTREFFYYQSSRMKDNPLWQRVTDCFSHDDIDFFAIAESQAETDRERLQLANRFSASLTALRSIHDMQMTIQTVPVTASIVEAIDIFDRVNSQGTKLSDAELALTHVVAKWPDARRAMKEKIEELAAQKFEFDLTFMTRCMAAVVADRALFETLHGRERSELENGWDRLSSILDYLVNVLPAHAHIHSTYEVSTTNALVPLIVYLNQNGGAFPSHRALKSAVRWLLIALTWARYTSQTDQRLEQDVSIIMKEKAPWESLVEQVVDQRGRIELKPGDFEGRGIANPLYKTAFIVAKAKGAVDWFNGVSLGHTHGPSYKLHRHHIFPKGVLFRSELDKESHIHKKIVNEIANRAFLTAESNFDLSDSAPADYLPRVEREYPGALRNQFVPMNTQLWEVERYEDFLSERRRLMAEDINLHLDSLIQEQETEELRSIEEIIDLGESASLEFKSTLQWDVRQNQSNKNLNQAVIKSVAAFLNTNGGTLIIGVEDDGNVYGLESDFKLLGGSIDKFEQKLHRLIGDYIGVEHSPLVSTRFEPIDGHMVCVVDVDKAFEPVFARDQSGQEQFYVRTGNATRSLGPGESMQYIANNWS